MRYLLAFLLLLATPARADDSTPQPLERTWCSAYLPPSAISDVMRGKATVSLHILPDGSVADTAIENSSGYPEIDNAARRCVSTWQFRPAIAQGKPVEATSQASVQIAAPKLHSCVPRITQWQLLKSAKGVTEIGFIISEDGHPTGAQIITFSGNPDVDDESLACIAKWRYLPATKNGAQVPVPWTVDIVWNVEHQPFGISGIKQCLRAASFKPEDLSSADITALTFAIAGGSLYDLKLERSSGNRLLDNAALRCASTSSYRETVYVGGVEGYRMNARIDWKTLLPVTR